VDDRGKRNVENRAELERRCNSSGSLAAAPRPDWRFPVQANDFGRGYETICKVPDIFGNCPCLPRLILPYGGMLAVIASTLVLHRHKPAVVACNRLAAADSNRAADYSRWHRR
jgi:hypothetical protein